MKDKKKTSNMPEKKKEHPIAVAVACIGMAILFIVSDIYFGSENSIWEIILSGVMSIVLIFFGVVLIYGEMFKKKTETEIYTLDHILEHRIRKFYRKDQRRLKRKNDDMFHILHRYSVHKFVPISFLFLLLMLLLGIACFLKYDYGPESRMLLYGIGVILGIYFVTHIVYLLLGGYVKQFKNYMIQSEYDVADLNQDFKSGVTFSVSSGVLNVGWKYTLYYNYGDKKQSFILMNAKIKGVEKRLRNKETPIGDKESYNTIHTYIRICTEHEWFEIQTGNIAGDMILEEFQLRGIEINKINEIYERTGESMRK